MRDLAQMDLCNRSSADVTTAGAKGLGDDAAKHGRLSVDAMDGLILLPVP